MSDVPMTEEHAAALPAGQEGLPSTRRRRRRSRSRGSAATPFAIWVLLGVLGIAAVLSLGRATSNAFRADWGGWDFHPYWYAGHFVRQGADPYVAFLAGAAPTTPVRYVDGVVVGDGEVVGQGGGIVPANSAPMALVGTAFAFLSWPRAHAAWFALNLGIALLLPLAVFRLLPARHRPPVAYRIAVALSFYAFQGTRVALAGGQTTLLVFALMVAAVGLAPSRPLPAGLALGLALSKWSLALPVAAFLLYRRQARVVAVALLVQAASFAVVSLAPGTSVSELVASQVEIVRMHASMEGIHLATLLPTDSALRWLAAPAITAAVGLPIAAWAATGRPAKLQGSLRQVADYHVLTALVLWGLLVAYHRNYDSLVALLFVVLLVSGLVHREWWRLDQAQRLSLAAVLGLLLFGLVMPGEVLGRFQAPSFQSVWLTIVSQTMTLSLLFMEGLTLWLLWRLKPLRRTHARA